VPLASWRVRSSYVRREPEVGDCAFRVKKLDARAIKRRSRVETRPTTLASASSISHPRDHHSSIPPIRHDSAVSVIARASHTRMRMHRSTCIHALADASRRSPSSTMEEMEFHPRRAPRPTCSRYYINVTSRGESVSAEHATATTGRLRVVTVIGDNRNENCDSKELSTRRASLSKREAPSSASTHSSGLSRDGNSIGRRIRGSPCGFPKLSPSPWNSFRANDARSHPVRRPASDRARRDDQSPRKKSLPHRDRNPRGGGAGRRGDGGGTRLTRLGRRMHLPPAPTRIKKFVLPRNRK